MLFYTLWNLVELVFVWFVYVETKGPTLEEIARIFDGDSAVANIDMEQVQRDIRTGRTDDGLNHDGQRRRLRKRGNNSVDEALDYP